MAPDLSKNDHEEIIVNLGAINKVDHHMETLEGDNLHKKDYEFCEEVTDHSDANLDTIKDREVNYQTSDQIVEFLEVLDEVDQHMETVEGDYFNQKDYEIYEEITDESDSDWKTTKDEEVHSKMSKGGIENFKTIDGPDALDRNFQDLPDELILKVLSFSEPKDLITSGQVSKRLRRISYDNSLWQRVNLSEKIVKTELLEIILEKGCKSLDLSNSVIFGSLRMHHKSQLRDVYLSICNLYIYDQNIVVLEKILASCCSLEKLEIRGLTITPKMASSICQNEKTLQKLDLYHSFGDESRYLKIIKCCQELKEVELSSCIAIVDDYEEISDDCIQSIVKLISPNIEMLDLSDLDVRDNHVKILLGRCKKIKALHLGGATLITDHSLTSVKENLNLTLEKLSFYYNDRISVTGLLELKSMPRLKSLRIEAKSEKDEDLLKYHLAPFEDLIIFRDDSTPDYDPEGLVSNPARGLNLFSFDAVLLYMTWYCILFLFFGN